MSHSIDDRIVEPEPLLADRRDSFRMPQPGAEIQVGRLRIGSKTCQVDVLDESAGGFLLSGERIPKTRPTKPVELLTASGRHILRVVWRRNIDGKTRIGLQRLQEEDFRWRQDSSWIIWMLLAVILGFGVGYVFAFRDQAGLVRRFAEISRGGSVVNSTSVEQPADTPDQVPESPNN